MTKIRLMIVDDHEVVRLGMRAAFALEPDIQIVGEASNGGEAVAKINVLDPQVILMDVQMEKMDGIEACREIKSRYPHIQVLMITSFTNEEAVLASIVAGASGYLLKNVSRAELLKAIRHIASGQSLLDPKQTEQVLSRMTAGNIPTPGEDLT